MDIVKRCPNRHTVALCRCKGYILTAGAVSHSSGTYCDWIRRKHAMLCLVQDQMRLTSVHEVYLCRSVSVCWQWLHLSVSCRLMACNLWFVDTTSWMMAFNVVLITCGSVLVCIFFHTKGHGTFGHLDCILISIWEFIAVYLCSCISYICRICGCLRFWLCRVGMYACSWKYSRRCSIVADRGGQLGGESLCFSILCCFIHSAVKCSCLATCCRILLMYKVLHFACIWVIFSPPSAFFLNRVASGIRKIQPSHTNRVINVVICAA
jgi:hypothetical protein